MKKLLLILLVVALASFLLVGCMPTTPAEGEGEGEGEAEGVTVAIADSVTVGVYTYVKAGSHDITVTFPAPVTGIVTANITACGGDYRPVTVDAPVVLFPDATKKVWTGSVTFTASASGCCASYVEVNSGECSDVVCIAFPVIVDGGYPYALIEVDVANCECDGCAITFSSIPLEEECEEAELCCGDDCSGLASWSINLYDAYPFNVCCDPTICEEPIATDSGVCPIEFTTACLPAGTYYAVVNLVDNVGLEQNYYAKIVVSGGTANTSDCSIVVTEGFEAPAPYCITWATDPTDTIGACIPIGPQPDLTQVTLTMAVAGAGSGTTDPVIGTHTYDYGEVVDIEAIAAVGSVFTGWSTNANIDDDTAAITTVTMNGDQTAEANFDLLTDDEYTLTVNIVGSGSVTKSPDQATATYLSGTVVTLDPQADDDWTFSGWSGDLSGSNDPKNITMNSDKTVTATFTQTLGPEAVDLGTAESEGFVILSEAGITDIPASVITGNIGTWPIDGATIGVTCAEVSGTIYDRDAAYTGGGGGVTTCRLTDDTLLNTAVIDMRAAYTAAANATPGVGPFLNLGGGTVAGQTLVPGVYTWGSNVTITTNLILSGGANDVWIFQITGTLDISSNMKVLLTGGAQAKNIFWQVADVVTLGTGSHFEGIILAKTKIAMQTGASINGRLWAQTEVTLDQNTVTEP